MKRALMVLGVVVVAGIAVALVAILGGDDEILDAGTPNRINVGGAVAVEIQIPPTGEDVQLITMTGSEAVASFVEVLDADLVAELGSCDPEIELRFFDAAGAVTTIGFRCGNEPWLIPEDDGWTGYRASAPVGFGSMVDQQLALLP